MSVAAVLKSRLQGVVFQRARAFQELSPQVRSQVQALRAHLLTEDVRKVVINAQTLTIHGKDLLHVIAKWQPVNDPKALVWGLVLDGFMEQKDSTLDGVSVDQEVFSVVDPTVLPTESVWSLKDGAGEAGNLQQVTADGVSTVYMIVNDKKKTASIFASESAREVVEVIDVPKTTVEFTDEAANGVKLTSSDKQYVFGTASKPQQDEWVNAFVNAGAVYREAFNTEVESAASFYDLKDMDMEGNEVSMSQYKGKVLLVVNVSSACGLTPTNYPQLVELDKKYRDQGLQILAFPCNQFAQQEPGTDEEIMGFVQQYGCDFPFFQKKDVNGKKARSVFSYLKAKLPDSTTGPYIKWNFTKFLIDRNGNPVKRHAPLELPFTFEEEIRELLAQ